MSKSSLGSSFAALFKKYRLRSEIETLSEFGDLLAEEGIVYETSLFTRWQNGERVPRDRRIILEVIKVFVKRNAIQTMQEANLFLNAAGLGYLNELEQGQLPELQNGESKILQASLGGLLKDYRTQKNITQNEVAFSLGWKDIVRLSNIELGIEKPTRTLIDEICKALDLKEQEKNHLLLVGNYLPTLAEIETVRTKVKSIIDKWPFPAVLLDFTWRILLINQKKIKFFNFTEKECKELFIRMPRVIEILFHPEYIDTKLLKKDEIEEWYKILQEILIHFRYAQQNRMKEKWYIELISKMMENALFRKMWMNTQKHEVFAFTKHGKKLLIHPKNKKNRLRLYFSVVPLLSDPRFELELCYPADLDTFIYFQK